MSDDDAGWEEPADEAPFVVPAETSEERDLRIEHLKRQYLDREEAKRRARQEIEAESFRAPMTFPNLEREFAEPDIEVKWTISDLHVQGTNTTITAGYKTGKTTLMLNLIRSLADNELFLGMHETRKLDGRIGYINYEVPRNVWLHEARKARIEHTERIWHVPARGFGLNIMLDPVFEWFTEQLTTGEVEVLIIDPYSGAFSGDENSNTDANRFLKRLDELKEASGVADLFMPIHTKRSPEEGNEQARGATKVDDWADTRWILTRKEIDEVKHRFISAEGRMVQLPEDQLSFDPLTNALVRTGGGSRAAVAKAPKLAANVDAILRFLLANVTAGQEELVKEACGNNRRGFNTAWAEIEKKGLGTRLKVRGKWIHAITDEGKKQIA